jgi:hypothetical protein
MIISCLRSGRKNWNGDRCSSRYRERINLQQQVCEINGETLSDLVDEMHASRVWLGAWNMCMDRWRAGIPAHVSNCYIIANMCVSKEMETCIWPLQCLALPLSPSTHTRMRVVVCTCYTCCCCRDEQTDSLSFFFARR